MLCACGSGKYVEKGKHGGLSDLKVLKKKIHTFGWDTMPGFLPHYRMTVSFVHTASGVISI